MADSTWHDKSVMAEQIRKYLTSEVAILKKEIVRDKVDGQTRAELVENENPVVRLKHSYAIRITYPLRFRYVFSFRVVIWSVGISSLASATFLL